MDVFNLNVENNNIGGYFSSEQLELLTIIKCKTYDEFIDKMNAIRVVNENELSDMAIKILEEAEKDERGTVLVVNTMEGTMIQAGSNVLNKVGIRRDEAKAYSAVMELVRKGYLSQSDGKGEIFQLTNAAYEYIDSNLK